MNRLQKKHQRAIKNLARHLGDRFNRRRIHYWLNVAIHLRRRLR